MKWFKKSVPPEEKKKTQVVSFSPATTENAAGVCGRKKEGTAATEKRLEDRLQQVEKKEGRKEGEDFGLNFSSYYVFLNNWHSRRFLIREKEPE